MSKFDTLLDSYGCTDMLDFMEEYSLNGCVPGICLNDGCDYTTEYEPDQGNGWCELCGTNSVCSGLVLLGVI